MRIEWRPDPEVELDLLGAEADHRIANNLSLIASLVRLRSGSVVDGATPITAAEVRAILDDVAARITAVGALHRLLTKSRSPMIDLAGYLQEVCAEQTSSLGFAGRIEVSQGIHHAVPSCQALHIGLIVSEVVTNAVKHAYPQSVAGRISVRCRAAGDGALVVEIANDGAGLPEGFDPRTAGGLGFRLIRMLTVQLRARFTFEATAAEVCFRLRVPRHR